jgi:serine/threonine protein kinase/tetratricopeptide (TPR) repeat protein
MKDLTGQSLDRYEIVTLIGEGGMAIVYQARQPRLKRDVAVKVMRSALASDPTFRERFELEAQAIANLRHPNILTVHDYGETDDGQLYLVVEYVRGGTLRQRLAPLSPPQRGEAAISPHEREAAISPHEGETVISSPGKEAIISPPVEGIEGGKPIPLEQTVEIVAQVAEALDYAHRQGVIHRDVKPNNILLTREGRPLLADFGLVKPIQSDRRLTASGVMLGTPDYVAPEQARGLEIDGRADIYALGVMLFEMLTGQHPFTGETPISVVIKHISEPMPRPSTLNPNVSPALDEVVARATAKSPDERYQRAGDMARALRAALLPGGTPEPGAERLAPSPPAIESLSPIPAPRPWQRRPRVWAVRAAALAVALALAVVLIFLLASSEDGQEPGGAVPKTQPGETVILIARFKAQPGSEQFDVSQRIHDELSTTLRQVGETQVSVYQTDEVIESSEAAVALGRERGATTVIWGYYDDLGISPYVETVGGAQEGLLSIGLERFNLEAGEAADFKRYIVQDLPQEVSFLTALSLVQTFAPQGRLDKTMLFMFMAAENLPADPHFRGGDEVVLFFQGIKAQLEGDLTGALEHIGQAIAIRPDSALFYTMRSLVYFKLEEADLAMADLEQAIALEPGNALAYTIKGSAAWMVGDLPAAFSAYDRLTELNPDDWTGYVLKSWVSFEMGDLTSALAALDRLEEMAPDDFWLAPSRGLVYEKMGQGERAAADYDRAVAMAIPPDLSIQVASILGDQPPPYAYLFECATYQAQGQTEQALASCDKVLQISPAYFDALWKRGQLYVAQGQLEAAMDDFTAAIQADPSLPWVYYLRAQALVELGRTDEAQADLARALELDPADELRRQIEALQGANP